MVCYTNWCRHSGRFLFMFALLVLVATQATADEVAPEETSLGFAPAEASFYMATMSNVEKTEALLGSRCWQQIVEMLMPDNEGYSFLADFIAAIPTEDEPIPEEWLENLPDYIPEDDLRTAISAYRNLLAHDVFIYSDESISEWSESLNQYAEFKQSETYAAQLMLMQIMRSFEEGSDDSQAIAELSELESWLGFCHELFDDERVPTIVMGARCPDSTYATEYLNLIAMLPPRLLMADAAEGQNSFGWAADLVRRFEGVETEDGYFLTVTYTIGELLNLVAQANTGQPFDQAVTPPGPLREAFERRLQTEIVFAVGRVREYLLLTVCDSTERLAEIGQGERLISRAELAAIRDEAPDHLSSVFYLSDRTAQTLNGSAHVQTLTLDSLEDSFSLLGTLYGWQDLSLDPQLRDEISADLDELSTDLKALVPEQGGWLNFAFLTPRGFEGYTYRWSENRWQDGSERLTILDHLGGDPLVAFAGRQRGSLEKYDLLAKWVGRAAGYYDAYAPLLREYYPDGTLDRWHSVVAPMLQRAHTITREQLLPSLADGQSAWVVDQRVVDVPWLTEYTGIDGPFTLPEAGVVYGVSDAERLRQAASNYYQLADDVIEQLAQLEAESATQQGTTPVIPPGFTIPRPEHQPLGDGTMYYYPLPPSLPVEAFLPNVVLSDHWAIASLSQQHSQQLLQPQPLASVGPLARQTDPLAAVTIVNFAGLVGVVESWYLSVGNVIPIAPMESPIEGWNDPSFVPPTDDLPRYRPIPTGDPPIAPNGLPTPSLTPEAFDSYSQDQHEADSSDSSWDEDQLPQVIQPTDDEERFELPSSPQIEDGFFPEEQEPLTIEEWMERFQTIASIYKCFQGYRSATYLEGDATVTHYEYHFEDLPE